MNENIARNMQNSLGIINYPTQLHLVGHFRILYCSMLLTMNENIARNMQNSLGTMNYPTQLHLVGHFHKLKCISRFVCVYIYIYIYIYTHTHRRNVPDFGRMFLMLKYTDITQNTSIQSWTVTEIMAREKCGLLAVPRPAPVKLTCYPYTAHVHPWEWNAVNIATAM